MVFVNNFLSFINFNLLGIVCNYYYNSGFLCCKITNIPQRAARSIGSKKKTNKQLKK